MTSLRQKYAQGARVGRKFLPEIFPAAKLFRSRVQKMPRSRTGSYRDAMSSPSTKALMHQDVPRNNEPSPLVQSLTGFKRSRVFLGEMNAQGCFIFVQAPRLDHIPEAL